VKEKFKVHKKPRREKTRVKSRYLIAIKKKSTSAIRYKRKKFAFKIVQRINVEEVHTVNRWAQRGDPKGILRYILKSKEETNLFRARFTSDRA